MHVCTSCGFEYEGKYCPQCGVNKNDGRIYFKDQLHDALYYVFSLSSPLSTTFKGLMINPGKVGRAYIEGKRKKYYTPIKYFILCSAIYFLTVKITGIDPDAEYTSEIIRKNANYFVFILVPLFALISKLFFFKQKYHYAEYLAYSFFLCGHYILLSTLYIPVMYFFPSAGMWSNITIIYLVWGLISFHSGNLLKKIFLSILTTAVSYILYVLLLIGIIVSYLYITGNYELLLQ